MQDKGKGIIIIGAGGHSKVVLSALLARGEKIIGFLDDNPALTNATIAGFKVLGNLSQLQHLRADAFSFAFGIGNNRIRQQIAKNYPALSWKTVIHPNAYVHESVQIGEGSVVFAGAVIQPDTVIGKHVIINTAASVDHDCHIGDFVHIAPGSHLAGGVTVKEGAFLGIKSCAIVGISIGAWCTLGAGGVVVKDIDDLAFAKGIPAKIYKFDNKEGVE